jgi:hypothetical protein
MSGRTSPATRFTDVQVANDQTGALWSAPVASIRSGRIIVNGKPPKGFLERPGSTFTITAADGGGRRRRFPLVIHDPSASDPPAEFAFT